MVLSKCVDLLEPKGLARVGVATETETCPCDFDQNHELIKSNAIRPADQNALNLTDNAYILTVKEWSKALID